MHDTALDLAADEGEWGFWRTLADTELFLLLIEEAKGQELSPKVFDLSEGPMVLAFDREDRLAGFSPVPVPYAALPGRVLAALATQQGLAVGLNLGSGARSEMVLPNEALAWLVATLQEAPAEEAEDRVVEIAASAIGAEDLAAVQAALQGALGLAGTAVLAAAVWASGRQGDVLALEDVAEADRPGLARAVSEALALSGPRAAALDVIFPQAGSALAGRLRAVGRIWRATPVETPVVAAPAGPGMDPQRPPVLK